MGVDKTNFIKMKVFLCIESDETVVLIIMGYKTLTFNL